MIWVQIFTQYPVSPDKSIPGCGMSSKLPNDFPGMMGDKPIGSTTPILFYYIDSRAIMISDRFYMVHLID
jgi:hypothetical protein